MCAGSSRFGPSRAVDEMARESLRSGRALRNRVFPLEISVSKGSELEPTDGADEPALR